MPLCDGCGAQVDEAHIRSRIERLEHATRYRPIHVQVLFLAAAPPSKPEDDFYRAATSAKRSAASQMFFDEISKSIGRKPGDTADEEATLGGISARRLLSRLRRRMSRRIARTTRHRRHEPRRPSPAAYEHFLQTKICRANLKRIATADRALPSQLLGRPPAPAQRQAVRRSHRIRRRANR